MLGYVPGGSRTYTFDQQHAAGSIDSYIFADFQKNSITPAPRTTDWEFIRRVTLDLTGRIPTPDRVLTFVADTSPDKRAKLIDELLASRSGWTSGPCIFGDLYQNTANRPSTGLNRFPQGRNAFYKWIQDSLANGKPYNQMATRADRAPPAEHLQRRPVNWMVDGVITGGPTQDIMDQMTAYMFDTFLGISHVNCLLCHNGRGHLDQLSLWGSETTRYQAWQLASFLSRTSAARTPVDPSNNNIYYWSLLDNPDELHDGLRAEHHHRQSSGARRARRVQVRPALLLRAAAVHLQRRRRPSRAKTTARRWRATSPAISSSRAPP